MGACSGGGGGDGGDGGDIDGIPGISGKVCLDGASAYEIQVDGQDTQRVAMETDPLLSIYQGNIGGQIRAVSTIDVTPPEAERVIALAWGSGASVRYGTELGSLGTVLLDRPGAVTALASVKRDGSPYLIYGTERGIGIIGMNSSGDLVDAAPTGYRPVPSGVWSIAADSDGSRILFASGDGFVQVTSLSELGNSEACAGILTGTQVLDENASDYLPVKTKIASEKAFLYARHETTVTNVAPTFDEVYDPIFASMLVDVPIGIVRGVDLATGDVSPVIFDAADESFSHFDRFIPTDIAYDSGALYVIGMAYRQTSVQGFIATNCSGEGSDAQLACLREAAKDGTLTAYNENGLYAFKSGFFIFRDFDDLSKATHFQPVELAVFQHSESAPPFTFAIAVEGDKGFIRGPNFLLAMRRAEMGGDERWVYDAQEVDQVQGLITGIPNDLILYSGGAAASFTAVKADDGTGASALEFVDAANAVTLVDTGAIFVRLEGGGSNKVAAIEMANARGGMLKVENALAQATIGGLSNASSYVGEAAYNGSMLAFAWSSTGEGGAYEYRQPWNLSIQKGDDGSTRETLTISRSQSDFEFAGFPAGSNESDEDKRVRSVRDLHIGPVSKIAVLYSGYADGKWYLQTGLYRYECDDNCTELERVALSTTLEIEADADAHPGRIQSVKHDGQSTYTIVFTGPDGLYRWRVEAGTSTSPQAGTRERLIKATGLVDAALDALGGNTIAFVKGTKIYLKDISNPQAAGTSVSIPGASGENLPHARVALGGSTLAVATPNGSTIPFSLFSVSSSGSPQLVTSCTTCQFLDVKIFSTFSRYLLTSSVAGGIEIYGVE